MQNLVDISSDDGGSSPASATWACCACTYQNKALHLVCELCSTQRSTPASDSQQQNSSDRWECSTCTFMNAPLVLCCEICNQLRSSITNEASKAEQLKSDVAITSAAAEPSTYKASASAAAAHAVTDAGKREAAACSADRRERFDSSSYCSSCAGNFLSAHALQTHQCSHAPLAKRARLQRFNTDNSQSRGPVVIPNFVTAEHEAEILAALDLDQAVAPFYGGSATVSHTPVWVRDQSYHNM
jgi:hypothetical protein